MLSINSTIHEIEQAHETMNLKQIAKQVSVGEQKLRKVLTFIGYEYDDSKRKWRYVLMDETKDCRNRSLWLIMEQMNNGDITHITNTEVGAIDMNSIVKQQNDITHITDTEQQPIELIEITKSNIGNIEIAEFTQEEIIILKQLAQQQMAEEVIENVSNGSKDVLEAIQSVPSGSTNKKTFVIQDELIAQFDAFCDHHRIKKSDFLAVAIQDALRKYS